MAHGRRRRGDLREEERHEADDEQGLHAALDALGRLGDGAAPEVRRTNCCSLRWPKAFETCSCSRRKQDQALRRASSASAKRGTKKSGTMASMRRDVSEGGRICASQTKRPTESAAAAQRYHQAAG